MARTILFETETNNFSAVLGNGKIYRVPPFQRDYSWNEENWDDLWLDILGVRQTGQPHYMGAIVLQAQDSKNFTIIDGQQRLATLSIIGLAIIKNLQDLIDLGIDPQDNDARKELLLANYIGSRDAVSLNYSSKLFLNENNDAFYQTYLVQLRTPNNIHRLTSSERLLWDAFQYFYKKVKEYLGDSISGKALAEFMDRDVADLLMFIQITVEDELNAYMVFETLNARGVGLAPTDLLKNYLLSLSGTSGPDQRIAKEQWQRIIRITDLDDFPKFLRHFWNSRNPLVRKEGLFKAIRQTIRSREEAFVLLNDLELTAGVYAALEDPNDELWNGNRDIQKRIRELSMFRVTQPYPLLLNAYLKFPTQEFERVLRMSVVVSFRYNVIGGLNPNIQEEVYNRTARGIYSSDLISANQVAEELRAVYPSDEEFSNAFTVKSINTRRSKRLVRYILFELESQISGIRRSDEEESGSIEHILPENPSEEWNDAFTPEVQGNFIYRLGNLTLLEDSKNREIQNRTYVEKLPMYKTSQYVMTNTIDYPEWTETQLRSRQHGLARYATAILRF